ncbi:non-ribosomal peptide synthetase [Saccharibacillus qingshengii]|uniref:non-ribosomal peptide synthetase n=1 Tax=Saccharibacillus qingshengii TaxID=1763540 RepID=UPI00155765AB
MKAELKRISDIETYWLKQLEAVEEKTLLTGEAPPVAAGIGVVEREFLAVDPLLRQGDACAAWSVLLQRYLRAEELAFAVQRSSREGMTPLLFRGGREDTFRMRTETAAALLRDSNEFAQEASVFANWYASGLAERPYNTGIGFGPDVQAVQALEAAGCDLFVVFTGTDRLRVRAAFREDVFSESFVREMLIHLHGLVVRMEQSPDARIGESDLLGEQEREILLNLWSGAAGEVETSDPIHRMISKQAALFPSREAVVCEDGSLSYGELERRSNALAAELRRSGLGDGGLAGIMARPSIEMIVSVLAVLKTGAAYLPIDPEYPAERIRFMLEDSGAGLLLLTPQLRAPEDYAGLTLHIDSAREWEAAEADLNPGSAEAPAYVIYTSGSTGTPKGVVVEHRSLINLAQWHIDHFRITPEDRTVKYAGFGFDASVWEIFPYLLQGASIHMIPEDLRLDPAGLNDHFNEKGITVAFLPTQLCEQFMEYDNYSLRVLLTGGDKLKTFRPRPYELHNCYGPTENTIVTTSHLVTELEANIPIGKPIRGSQILILDDYGHLQPIGVAGELCVAGDGLARGYLNRPELTNEKFVPHPYREGVRMYRTGDLARWKRDGTIEFLGRLDHQVKIRGFRIEIGEIEQRILECEGVRTCIVVPLQDAAGDAYLCAYVESGSGGPAEWSAALARTLPDYMVPARFVAMEKLPVNANGKIDRRALPQPESLEETNREMPLGETEERLHSLWSGVLGHDRFGVLDRFFDVGGHSLQAAVLRARIERRFGAKLSIRELFEYTTVRSQAEEIAKRTAGGAPARELSITTAPKSPTGRYPAYPAQARLFLIEQMEGAGTAYNAPALLRIEGPVDAGRLERSLLRMLDRHEALRTSFELLGERIMQHVHEKAGLRLAVRQGREEEIRERMDAFVRPFDLGQAPLMRAELVSCGEELHFMMLDFHHIAVDGVSMHVFFEEWSAFYQDDSAELAPPVQFKDFSVWYEREAAAPIRDSQLGYWRGRLSGELPMLQLPADQPRPEKQSFRGATLHREIGAGLQSDLKRLADRTGTTLFMVMLAAYGTLLGRYAGQEDVIVGVPVANRSREELHGVIGMFVNTLPLRTYPDKAKTFADYLGEVKAELLGAFDHQEYELGELVNELNVPRIAGRSPLFDTMFVMQNTGSITPRPNSKPNGKWWKPGSVEYVPVSTGSATSCSIRRREDSSKISETTLFIP